MRSITLRIACAQLAARPLSRAAAALRDVCEAIDRAADRGVDLVVLPECSYPGYVLLTRAPFRGIPGPDAALRIIAERARTASIAVCAGIARFDARGRLRNEAVYFDRRGIEIARYAKTFLWSFDARWFAAGSGVAAFDTEFGRLGMMICADGRAPEIARALRNCGAWLVLDPTAWVSFGASYARMQNPQADYMMRVRARENGLWLAAADKCGSEHGSVHYVGRSMLVEPSGDVIGMCSPDKPGMLIAQVVRRSSKPARVALAAAERAMLSRRQPPASANVASAIVGIFQGPARSQRRDALAALSAQGANAVIDTSAPAAAARAMRKLRGIRVARIHGRRMFAPEPARAAALGGADAILWTDPPADPLVREFARTRALENRIFVIVCARTRAEQPACVVDPDGRIAAEAIAGMPTGFVVALDVSRSRDKTVVAVTGAFDARRNLPAWARTFAVRPKGSTPSRPARGASAR